MNSSIYRFTLGMNSSQSQISIPVMLGDTGREWHINLSDGGKPYIIADGCMAKITIKRPTGTHLEEFCAIKDNTTIVYSFEQNENTAAVEGIHECDLTLYGVDGKLITTARFTMVVGERAINSYDIDLTDADFTAVDAMLVKEAERQAAEEERKEAEEKRKETAKNLDEALERVEEAKTISVASANSAQASETNAKASELNAINSANTAIAQAQSAEASASIAESSAIQAKASEEIANEIAMDTVNLGYRISRNDKRITNLEQGIMPSPFYTDNSVAYTKNIPVDACPYAEVSKVGGMTYDDGSVPELKSAKVTGLKIVGANLFNDLKWFSEHGFSNEGDYWNCKSKNEICFTNTTRRSGPMYINVVAKSDLSPNNSVMYLIVYYTDGSADVGCDVIPSTDFVTLSMVTDNSKTVDYIQWTYGSGGEFRLKGVSISFVDRGGYIPYTETFVPIPAEVQALDGYGEGLSADCCNYIDWDEMQFIKKVGKVDMGTLDWVHSSSINGFFSSSNLPVASATRAQGDCVTHTVVGKDYRNIENGEMIINDPAYSSRPRVYVQDNYYTDGETFKQAMQGVILYYELATPEVTDISDILSADNYIGVEGGGTITAVNENGLAVPTEITYMLKGATV